MTQKILSFITGGRRAMALAFVGAEPSHIHVSRRSRVAPDVGGRPRAAGVVRPVAEQSLGGRQRATWEAA